MRLQLACGIDPLVKKGLVLDRHVDTPEHSARHTEPRLEVPLVIDGQKTTDTKVVPQNALQTSRKVTALVAAAPGSRAAIPPLSGNALGARALAYNHQHVDMSLYIGSYIRAVVLSQQGRSGRKLLLLPVLSETRYADDRTPWGAKIGWGKQQARAVRRQEGEVGGGGATDASFARPEQNRAGGGSQACTEGWRGEMEMPARQIATGACRSHPDGEEGRVGWKTRAMRMERVVGGIEEGSRWSCSRASWVGDSRQRRDGRQDGC